MTAKTKRKRKPRPKRKAMRDPWDVQFFSSGTMIVLDRSQPTEILNYGRRHLSPYIVVDGPGDESDHEAMEARMRLCRDLRDFLNGGHKSIWVSELRRTGQAEARAVDGTTVTATGPMFDRNPPHCDWAEDETKKAKEARIRLIDRLFFAHHAEKAT